MRIAIISTFFAIILGTLAAGALYKKSFFGKNSITILIILPIALPGIITGISLRSTFGVMGIPFSTWTIIIGHATFCMVVVYNNVVARLRRTSPNLIQASMDLGANNLQTFFYVILPNMGTAILAGGMLAFALSFDEVIVTTFTAGQQTTLTDMDVFRINKAKTKANNKCSSSFYNVYNFYTYSFCKLCCEQNI